MAITIPVKDQGGKQVSKIEVSETVFAVPMNEAVVWQALVRQRANARQGTASTKTRGEVAGTTRKPWRQKHTGRARVGTRKSPIWRKGGIAFGPRPRDFSQALPIKMRRLAIRCLLSDKRSGGHLEVLDDIKLAGGKTKELLGVLGALSLEGSVLLVTRGGDPNIVRSATNLKRVKTLPANLLNAGDLLKYEHVVMTVDAVREAESLWSKTKIDRKRAPWAGPPAEPEAPETPPAEEAVVVPAEPEEAPEAEAAIAEEAPVAEAEAPTPKRARARKPAAKAEKPAAKAEKPAAKAEKPAAKAEKPADDAEEAADDAEKAADAGESAEEQPKPRRRRTTSTGTTRSRAAKKKADS